MFVLKRECTSASALSSRSSCEVGVEAAELVGREHALVDDDPRAEATGSTRRSRARCACARCTRGARARRPRGRSWSTNTCAERGHHLARRLRPGTSSSTGTSRQPRTSKPSSASTFSTVVACVRVDVVGGQERDAGRVRARRAGARRRRPPGRSGRGSGSRMPGAVAGVGLGAGRAAVVQAADRGERLVDDRVALAALHVDDEADAARVVLEARVVEPLATGRSGFACGVSLRSALWSRSATWGRPCLGRSAPIDPTGCIGWSLELATAGRHWPVGGPEIVAAGVRIRSGVRRSESSSSSASTRRPTAAASPGARPIQLLDADRRTAKRTDAAAARRAARVRRSTFAHCAFETARRRSGRVDGNRTVSSCAAPKSARAQSDSSKRTCVQLRHAEVRRRRTGSRSTATVRHVGAAEARCPSTGSRRSVTRWNAASEKSQPERSQRTSSTSTRRTRSNARPPARAPTTRTPDELAVLVEIERDRRRRSPRTILARDVVTRHPRASRPLHDSPAAQVPPCPSSLPSRNSLASLVARDVTKSFGPHVVLDRVSSPSGPAAASASSRPTAPARPRCCASSPGIEPPDAGTVTRTPPTATVGYLPQEPERRAGETVRAYLARRTGVADAELRLDAGEPRARAADAPGADDAYAHALDRVPRARRAPTSTPASARCCADLGLPERIARPRDAGAVGRPGRPREPRRDPARPLRRVPARRADQRPRLRRARPARAVPHRRAAGRRGDRVARPRVPRPHDHAACSSSTSTPTPRPSTRAAGRVPRRAGDRAPARRGGVRGRTRRSARRCADRAAQQRQWSVQGVAKVKQERRDRQVHPALPHATAASTSRPRRRSPTGRSNGSRPNAVDKPWEGWDLRMEIAAAPRSGAVVARLARRDRAARRLHARAGRPRRSTTASGSRSLGANGSGKTTLLDAAARPAPARRPAHAWLGPGVVVGELDQAARRVRRRRRAARRASRPRAGCSQHDARSLLAKFGLGADHVARPADSLSPGERTRASLALLSAPGRQLPRARRADQPPRPARDRAARAGARRRSTGTLLLVTHDRALLDAVTLTRRIELADGRSSSRSVPRRLDRESERDRGGGRDVQRVDAGGCIGMRTRTSAAVEPAVGEARSLRRRAATRTARASRPRRSGVASAAGVSASNVKPSVAELVERPRPRPRHA